MGIARRLGCCWGLEKIAWHAGCLTDWRDDFWGAGKRLEIVMPTGQPWCNQRNIVRP